MTKRTTVIFDLGGVLIDWNPDYVYKTIFENPEELKWFYENICKPILPAKPEVGSLIYAISLVLLMWFFAWLLDKKKIYIKV